VADAHIRHIMELFRHGDFSASDVAQDLGISRSRTYDLRTSYLRAYAEGLASEWHSGSSGGNHHQAWPEDVCALLRRRLSSDPPSSYSFAASEALRLYGFRLDRAQVRHWAIHNGLAHQKPVRRARAPTRRWQRHSIGELWQLDATPHRWFPGQDFQCPMLNMLDDCSRLFVGSKLYGKENLLAYMDFLPSAFLEYGFPLELYVDYHSFFFTHTPDALTELGRALKFYGVTFRYASTPRAKGKVEREHQYWQNRLPALFGAEGIDEIGPANEEIRALRHHRNAQEKHRELGMPAQQAWHLAEKEGRSVIRPAQADAWWPYVWSSWKPIRIGDDGRVPIGSQRIRLEIPPRSRVVLCTHPSGHQSVIARKPDTETRPLVLFSNRPK
jgi:hypothetical protein